MSGRDRDVVWEHGENLYPGWRCNYCRTQKGGGGATRLKQHLAHRGAEVVHCRNVPPDVRDFFQRELDRAKKATADRARERLRREKAAAEGNYPGDEEDEEAQVQRAMDLSRAEAEFRRGVEQRGGAYERGGGSGSTRGNVMQRMFRKSTSQRESPVVEDYNLAAGGSIAVIWQCGWLWTQRHPHVRVVPYKIVIFSLRKYCLHTRLHMQRPGG